MERRGIYRKGSAGHSRNVSSYRLMRQNFKKWRVPLTVLAALVLVFGAAPITGEQFQTSLLTPQETSRFAKADPEELRKALLNALNTFVHDCSRFLIAECEADGNRLISQIASVAKGDVNQYLAAAENFAGRFEATVALKACKFDGGTLLVQSRAVQKAFGEFLAKYGDVLDPAQYAPAAAHAGGAASSLKQFVDYCENRL